MTAKWCVEINLLWKWSRIYCSSILSLALFNGNRPCLPVKLLLRRISIPYKCSDSRHVIRVHARSNESSSKKGSRRMFWISCSTSSVICGNSGVRKSPADAWLLLPAAKLLPAARAACIRRRETSRLGKSVGIGRPRPSLGARGGICNRY